MRGVNYENNNKFTITSPSLDCLGFYQFIDTTHFVLNIIWVYLMTILLQRVISVMTRFFVTKGGNKMEEFKYLIPEESIDAIITNVSRD